jgi:hypothetical protein
MLIPKNDQGDAEMSTQERPPTDSVSPILSEVRPVAAAAAEKLAAAAHGAAVVTRAAAEKTRGLFATVRDRLAAFAATFSLKSFLFSAFILPVLGLIYWHVNSIGLRMTIPPLAANLYTFFLFAPLADYEGWRDLDYGNVAALFQLSVVWAFTVLMLRIFVYREIPAIKGTQMNEQFVRRFIITVGLVLLVWDAAMFYRGICDYGGFGENEVEVMPVIATAGYTTAILAVGFLHLILKHPVTRSES